MKNVTVSIDDETHRRARIRAAELGTSAAADAMAIEMIGSQLRGFGQSQMRREIAERIAIEGSRVPLGTIGIPYFSEAWIRQRFPKMWPLIEKIPGAKNAAHRST